MSSPQPRRRRYQESKYTQAYQDFMNKLPPDKQLALAAQRQKSVVIRCSCHLRESHYEQDKRILWFHPKEGQRVFAKT